MKYNAPGDIFSRQSSVCTLDQMTRSKKSEIYAIRETVEADRAAPCVCV